MTAIYKRDFPNHIDSSELNYYKSAAKGNFIVFFPCCIAALNDNQLLGDSPWIRCSV